MSSRLSVCSLVLCCVVLAGCKPEVTRSSEDSVIIKSISGRDVEGVTALAEAECAKHGKRAKLVGLVSNKWIYNCI